MLAKPQGVGLELMGDAGEIAKTIAPLVANLAKLTGPLSEELGLFFGDKIRTFRHNNASKIVEGAFQRLEDASKSVGPVPPRLLLPILEAASIEENPTLQDMWSGLLASASDQADNMSPSYAETLKALTPIEARSVKVLYDSSVAAFGASLGPVEDVSLKITFGLDSRAGEAIAPILIIETLERLGLIRREYDLYRNRGLMGYMGLVPIQNMFVVTPSNWMITSGDKEEAEKEPLPKVRFDLVFTSYGIQFMRACQGPAQSVVPNLYTAD